MSDNDSKGTWDRYTDRHGLWYLYRTDTTGAGSVFLTSDDKWETHIMGTMPRVVFDDRMDAQKWVEDRVGELAARRPGYLDFVVFFSRYGKLDFGLKIDESLLVDLRYIADHLARETAPLPHPDHKRVDDLIDKLIAGVEQAVADAEDVRRREAQ